RTPTACGGRTARGRAAWCCSSELPPVEGELDAFHAGHELQRDRVLRPDRDRNNLELGEEELHLGAVGMRDHPASPGDALPGHVADEAVAALCVAHGATTQRTARSNRKATACASSCSTGTGSVRSEEHTSELQSRENL